MEVNSGLGQEDLAQEGKLGYVSVPDLDVLDAIKEILGDVAWEHANLRNLTIADCKYFLQQLMDAKWVPVPRQFLLSHGI